MRLLVAGAGYVGRRLAELALDRGDETLCLSRTRKNLPPGAQGVQADMGERSTLDPACCTGVDHVVFCAAPDSSEEAAYRRTYVDGLSNLLDALAASGSTPSLFFTSSTAVYAQVDGTIVDETSPTEPVHYSGKLTLEAEQRLRDSGFPSTVVRCGGIYGPGRTRLVDAVRGRRATFSTSVETFTNRIHRDDIAHGLLFLMDRADRDPLYVFVDEDPAPRREVLLWLAQQTNAPEPQGVPEFHTGRAGSRSNKRCTSRRLQIQGYQFRYPTFREGYAEMLAAGGAD